MPHQCTNCGRTFDDGSKEMLSGCPDCGGNKFQFRPAADADADAGAGGSPGPPDDPPASPDRGPAERASAAVREWVGFDDGDERPDGSAGDAGADRSGPDPGRDAVDPSDGGADPAEDSAQADARSGVVGDDELAAAANDVTDESATGPRTPPEAPPGEAPADPDDAEQPSEGEPPSGERPPERPDRAERSPPDGTGEDRPGLDQLREELNEQFESIRIVSPGQYELNLMELYDREEYIISLQEDGRYVIEVPDRWRDDE